MALRVFLVKIVGPNCSSIDDGEKVMDLIRPELEKGFTVEPLEVKKFEALLASEDKKIKKIMKSAGLYRSKKK